MVLSMETRITMEKFCDDLRYIFKFHEEEDFTMKWLDEEGKNSSDRYSWAYFFRFPRYLNLHDWYAIDRIVFSL